jgi:hypothetical protein
MEMAHSMNEFEKGIDTILAQCLENNVRISLQYITVHTKLGSYCRGHILIKRNITEGNAIKML